MPYNNVLLTILPLFWPKMPPIGLGYLQGYLASCGFNAQILDLNNVFYNLAGADLKRQWLDSVNLNLENKILALIRNNHPGEYRNAINKMLSFDILGFSCFKSNFQVTLEIVRFLRSKRKDIRVALGGPESARQFFKTSGRFDQETKQSADLLVVGEGEKALAYYLEGNKNKDKVFCFRQVRDLSVLPFPKYNGISFSSYPRSDAVPLQFSRGCIRKCAFCSERLLYKGFRRRDVQSIIDEISYHKVNNKSGYFIFFDSLINADLAALEALADKIIQNFGSVNWEAQIAIRDEMSSGLLDKMKESGCYNLFVGLESGCNRTLKRMNKGYDQKAARIFFKKLKRAGLFFGVSIIVGYPGETDGDFKESLDFIIRNKEVIPKIEQVNPFTYYEGTPAERHGDYRINKGSLDRMKIFTQAIKQNHFKYTNAFIGNLVENAAV